MRFRQSKNYEKIPLFFFQDIKNTKIKKQTNEKTAVVTQIKQVNK